MIFRTITDESTGAIKSIGLYGKSISELKNSISSIKSQGIINTIFNKSTINEDTIVRYNNAIIEATANNATMAEKQQIMKSAMEGLNDAPFWAGHSTKGIPNMSVPLRHAGSFPRFPLTMIINVSRVSKI